VSTTAEQLHHEFLELWLAVMSENDAEALELIENGGPDFCLYVFRHVTDCLIASGDKTWEQWREDLLEEMAWEDLPT
jgi:hypothetical protein